MTPPTDIDAIRDALELEAGYTFLERHAFRKEERQADVETKKALMKLSPELRTLLRSWPPMTDLTLGATDG